MATAATEETYSVARARTLRIAARGFFFCDMDDGCQSQWYGGSGVFGAGMRFIGGFRGSFVSVQKNLVSRWWARGEVALYWLLGISVWKKPM